MVVTALTMTVSFLCGCNPVLEQPMNSCMPREEPLKSVLSAIGAHKFAVYHGAYSFETWKQLQLWSTADLQPLVRPRPPPMSSDLVTVALKYNRDGSVQLDAKGRPKKIWTGNKPKMKASQTYCRAFGRAVAKLLQGWLKEALGYWQSSCSGVQCA